jgi:hypothetical protein
VYQRLVLSVAGNLFIEGTALLMLNVKVAIIVNSWRCGKTNTTLGSCAFHFSNEVESFTLKKYITNFENINRE